MNVIEKKVEFPGRRICMLVITHACNLNCSYCYEAYKGSRFMTFDMARRLITGEFDSIRDSKGKFTEINIEFMGGEPFVNFPLIKKVVEWLEKTDFGIPWICSCSTNGTLVTDDIKPWLIAHRNRFVPCLSYDGSPSMQGVNRGTSSHNIDIDFFRATWPGQNFHMTLSKETLPLLAEGVLDLQRKGCTLDIALAQGVAWTAVDAMMYREQLRLLAEAYLKCPSLKPIGILTRSLGGIGLHDVRQKKTCGTGTHMVAYDVDGVSYPCHLFTPLVLGPTKALTLRKSKIADGCDLQDPECDGCIFANWCPTCCGFNYRLRGDLSARDHNWCGMVRSQAVVTCEFQLQLYHRHICKFSSEDILQAKMAIAAYKYLKDDEG